MHVPMLCFSTRLVSGGFATTSHTSPSRLHLPLQPHLGAPGMCSQLLSSSSRDAAPAAGIVGLRGFVTFGSTFPHVSNNIISWSATSIPFDHCRSVARSLGKEPSRTSLSGQTAMSKRAWGGAVSLRRKMEDQNDVLAGLLVVYWWAGADARHRYIHDVSMRREQVWKPHQTQHGHRIRPSA